MRRLVAALLIAFPTLAFAGDLPTIAPTPPTSDNGDRIATTAWVNSWFSSVFPLANGKIFVGSAGGVATPQTPSGDCTITNAGVLTCLKTNGTAFTSYATAAVGQLAGTTTNDAASAGNIGELVSSYIASGSAVSLVNATAKDVTTISLTAGDWDVIAAIYFHPGASTSTAQMLVSPSTTLNTLDLTVGNFGEVSLVTQVLTGDYSVVSPPLRVSLSGTTTYHCVAQAGFTVSTMTAYGGCRARRIR